MRLLVELLIGLIHRINARADRRVDRELTEDLRCITARKPSCSAWPRPPSPFARPVGAGNSARLMRRADIRGAVR